MVSWRATQKSFKQLRPTGQRTAKIIPRRGEATPMCTHFASLFNQIRTLIDKLLKKNRTFRTSNLELQTLSYDIIYNYIYKTDSY